MVTLKTTLLEGGKKGILAEKLIQEASKQFFSLGVNAIETKCNELREKTLAEWKTRNPADYMKEYGLCKTTFHKGIVELEPLFNLYEPESICVYIYDTKNNMTNIDVPMTLEKLDDSLKTWKLHVFLRNFERKNNTLHEIVDLTNIEEVVFHELLHACGDSKWLGRCDGVIRPQIVGIEAIKQLLTKKT